MTAEINTMSEPNTFRIFPLSEKAVTIEFGDAISEDILLKVTGFNDLLQEYPFPGMITTTPAYTTVSVFFDPLTVMHSESLTGSSNFEKIASYLQQLQFRQSNADKAYAKEIAIPVCYGGAMAPDLDAVAAMHQLTTEEVIRLHCSATYKVYMIGFVPGFAYLGGLPEALFSPRRAVPRGRVPAGAVGIAGKQTGIYPIEIPGGWQIIGQTPLQLFNAGRQPPVLLNAGDLVKFHSITLPEFRSYAVHHS